MLNTAPRSREKEKSANVMDTMMDIAILFSVLNVALLLVLLYVYVKIALRSKASHSFGLVFFALLLLANNILTAYSYAAMAPFFGAEALPYLSAVSVLEFVGLAVFVKITV